eukprot:scaffold15_cov194-Alexandrium_tamarense.AAC.10
MCSSRTSREFVKCQVIKRLPTDVSPTNEFHQTANVQASNQAHESPRVTSKYSHPPYPPSVRMIYNEIIPTRTSHEFVIRSRQRASPQRKRAPTHNFKKSIPVILSN